MRDEPTRLSRARVRRLTASWLLLSALLACDAPLPASAGKKTSSALQDEPSLVRGDAPVAPFVARTLAGTKERVLVYVGATWCEPCRHFHDALLAGALDRTLAGVRVIEYDLDQHKQALVEAGYRSRLIPLFALPNADGTASTRAISGSVKGERAVAEDLEPRLRALLASP